MDVLHPTPLPHHRKARTRFERAYENKSVGIALLDQDVQHPVHPIVKIDVGGSRPVTIDKCARARARERVSGFVIQSQISFGLDNNSGAPAPDQCRPNESRGADQRVASKKIPRDHMRVWYRLSVTPAVPRSGRLKSRRPIINRQRDIAGHGLTTAKRRNKFSSR